MSIKKKNVFWGSSGPDFYLQRPLQSVKCTALVAILKHEIIGQYWFEDNNEQDVTINAECYVQVLEKLMAALCRQVGVPRAFQWFQ